MNIATMLQAITTLLWVAVVVLIILAVIRASRGAKVKALTVSALTLAGVAVLLTIVSAGLVFIQPEERGVVISAIDPDGYRDEPLEPGLNWIVPFFENVRVYPISRQTYTMSIATNEGQLIGDDSISARTSDGQEVLIDASVIYAIDPKQVVKVNIEWQDRYSSDLVRPLSRGAIRDAASQFGVQEVYSTQRAEMIQMISDQLAKKMNENGLTLVDFVLRNITFSPEYAASVEQKQIAEQQAQQARFTVEQRKQEAEQARQVAQGQADSAVINAKGQADARVIQAEAETKALDLIASALTKSPDLLEYTYVTRLGPNVQVMLVPSNSPYLFQLPQMSTYLAPGGSQQLPSLLPTPLPTPAPATTP
jgi:regulator of protease activity HflC (stomatin/prohibitin superfamily)